MGKPLCVSDLSTRTQRTFWTRVKRGAPEECWDWMGFCFQGREYGAFSTCRVGSLKRVLLRAHRVAFVLGTGQSLDGDDLVLHSCDRPVCCNPGHLSKGTPQQNMDEKHTRGRAFYVRGEGVGCSKLQDSDIPVIRSLLASGVTQAAIGRQFGISQTIISRIARGVAWTHV